MTEKRKKTNRQIGKAARAKGNRGELEFAKLIDHWLDDAVVKRTPNSGGLWIPGDLNGVPYIHVEAKRQETICMGAWIKQATEDCPEDLIPLIGYRKNHMRWRIDMDAEDFLGIYAVTLGLCAQHGVDLMEEIDKLREEKLP